MAKAKKILTTAQRLSGIVKSCRKIMRKDKGLNGDSDRLPILTWIMFLKFLDDNEQILETEALLNNEKYNPIIKAPYRWRDWAKNQNLTGDDLLAFINNEKAILPDGNERLGLFYYLRGLQSESGKNRKDVISTVFKGVNNRMINGYLLRDVVDKIDEIHFTSTEEIFTLSHLYESILKEMRDASGDAGEFYTPRPVVQFMVDVINPQIGETILDPACGTGGFLVASFEHLKKQAQKIEQKDILQKDSIFGGEAKSLPYLLSQMNLLLHGLKFPQIDPLNSLRFRLQEIGDNERVDIIITNPPFGGEEEKGILNNFPKDKRTSETALLFLQLIMRKLRRNKINQKGGRAAVVVPDGTLSSSGVSARIKKQLIENFNLHTIVRFGEGVFAPYTDIPSNVLFFEQGKPTNSIWFYEIAIPTDRKKYSKKKPLQSIELDPLKKWWNNRLENESSWKVKIKDIVKKDDKDNPIINLDIINPNRKNSIIHKTPIEIINNCKNKGNDINLNLNKLKEILGKSIKSQVFRTIKINEILEQRKNPIELNPTKKYKLLGLSLEGRGLFIREEKLGINISSKSLNKVVLNDFIYSRLFAWKGAFDYVRAPFEDCFVSNEFPTFKIDNSTINVKYLNYYFNQSLVWYEVEKYCMGLTKASRNRFKEEFFMQMSIPLPPLDYQNYIIDILDKYKRIQLENLELTSMIKSLFPSLLDKAFKGKI